MKKIFVLIFLTAFAGTAFSQQFPKEPNKQLRQLAEYLEQKGYTIQHQQSTMWGNGVTQAWNLDLIPGSKRGETVQDSICNTFRSLNKVASEFYHYEYHMEKTDSIKYSVSFCRNANKQDPEYVDTCKQQEKIYYEVASYSKYGGCSYFHHAFSTPTGIDYENMLPLDTTALKAQIQPVIDSFMALKGAKKYPVYWRHDEGFDDEVNKGLVFQTIHCGIDEMKQKGLAIGTHYFIPLKYKEEVETLYKQFDSKIYNYVNNHPEQKYKYNFTNHFPGVWTGNPINILYGECDDGRIREDDEDGEEYCLSCLRFIDGYHILSIKVKGTLWIPYEWYKLKSWINGKSEYLRGMKPTPREDFKIDSKDLYIIY